MNRRSSSSRNSTSKNWWLLGALAGVGAATYAVGRVIRPGRVELASTPADLSWPSWRKALLQTKDAIGDRRLGPLAASIAYGGTLAFFPLVVACVAIASILISPEQINDVVAALTTYLPSDIAGLLTAQLSNALDNNSANVLIAVAAVALALFGVSGAMNALVGALNVAYQREETRGLIKVRLISLGLTCLLVLGFLLVLPLLVLGGDILRWLGVPELLVTVFSVLRWVILAVIMMLGLAVVYRYAPDRPNAKWQWVSWGAIMATLLWLVVTAVFFIYAQNFANFSQSYSLFAGIIVLMIWLNFTGLIVLIGAAVNNQLEKRTALSTIV